MRHALKNAVLNAGMPPSVDAQRTLQHPDSHAKADRLLEQGSMGAAMGLNTYALGKEEGPAVWFLNTLAIMKATARQTGGAFGLIEQFAPVGTGSPYHVHRGEDETFYILDGELEFISEGRRFVSGAGGYVFLPRNTPHGFRVVGGSPARFLILVTPGGFEEFVTAMGEPASELRVPEMTAPDMAKLTALAAKHGLEILGPLPD
jgi:quercetin dioxygenase-like cupin family protein